MKRIYFDNAASTPMYKQVIKIINKINKSVFGNPSSLHKEGLYSKFLIEKARENISKILNCSPSEIFFTSGASEGNSLVLKNFKPIVFENSHSSVLLASQENIANEKLDFSYPLIDSETGNSCEVISHLDGETHIDLTQAIGKVKINLKDMKCALATCSAHKFGGPKGVGFIYIREDYIDKIVPLIYGHQEKGIRGGTENVSGIVGMSKALEITYNNFEKNIKKNDKIIEYIYKKIYNTKRKISTCSNIINITFNNINAQTAVRIFDNEGIAISAGSACNSKEEEPSKALMFYKYTEEEAKKTIRVSIGVNNTMREARIFVKKYLKIIDKYDV